MSLIFDIELPRRDFLLKLDGEFDKGTTGIFGPSGAGKTSFFKTLFGLETPSRGKIILNGRTLVDGEKKINLPMHKRRMGVVFQDKRLFPHMTIRDNLLFGQKYIKKSPLKLTEAVDLLDLGLLLDSYPHEISGGEQQRAAIGRALLMSPELLLLDEPFNAVDNSRRITMLPYLNRLRDKLDIPMLVISHDLPDIQRLTSQIYLINQGQCGGFGKVNDLMDQNGDLLLSAGQVNTFTVTGAAECSPGLFCCTLKESTGTKINLPFSPETGTVLTLPPYEISLSLNRAEGISIQNQIPGIIDKMWNWEGRLFCRVKGDLTLTAEITPQSAEALGLEVGSSVYSLFKAQSLNK
ncbi:MAG: ATP-binding cassette domain-containing protein [Spirochaetales bacterium]|nr:ATP-binding cassette domain-containing protein [Spirochaetales bacterium]